MMKARLMRWSNLLTELIWSTKKKAWDARDQVCGEIEFTGYTQQDAAVGMVMRTLGLLGKWTQLKNESEQERWE
jgi:hypothetical protein